MKHFVLIFPGGPLTAEQLLENEEIYPWDFRSISRRTYLLLNGLHIDSCYTDCLAEEFVDRANRVDKRIFERQYVYGFYDSVSDFDGYIFRHTWGRESDS